MEIGFEYKNQRSTLHGANDIQPASGLLVEGLKYKYTPLILGVEWSRFKKKHRQKSI